MHERRGINTVLCRAFIAKKLINATDKQHRGRLFFALVVRFVETQICIF